MKPLLIIKAGEKLPTLESVTGDFEDWILDGMGWGKENCIIVSVYKNEILPKITTVCGVIITGSSAMVSDNQQWIETTINWIQNIADTEIPVLGICFGHQLVAQALGGKVKDNPQGVEVGTVKMDIVDNKKDTLFAIFPEAINVQVSHKQSVISLPEGCCLLAKSSMDKHLAFRCGENIWGIQFHPEFNKQIVEKYVEYYQHETGDKLKENRSNESAQSSLILRQFARLLIKKCK